MHLYGHPEHLAARRIDAPGLGAVLTSSLGGIELFMWAFNQGALPTSLFLHPALSFATHEQLTPLGRPRKVEDMRVERSERLAREAEASRAD
jgi:hypothetical protein